MAFGSLPRSIVFYGNSNLPIPPSHLFTIQHHYIDLSVDVVPLIIIHTFRAILYVLQLNYLVFNPFLILFYKFDFFIFYESVLTTALFHSSLELRIISADGTITTKKMLKGRFDIV